MASREQIYGALESVYDTCSLFNGTRLNVVEMGLVHDIEVAEGAVRVRLLLTDPMCLYLFEMRAQIQEAVGALPGVESVDVEPVAGELWLPERMSAAARERLERRRRPRLAELGLSAQAPARP